MWKFAVLLLCLSGYCLAGPVGQKRNMPIVQQTSKDIAMTETEAAVNEDPNEMMIMSTLSLPSNATSIRADITDGFSCENKSYGYYADVDNDCQIFHVCLPVTYADGKENTFRWSFICPEYTIFSQESFTCMRPDDMAITCEESQQYYELNRIFGLVDSKETSNEATTAEEAEKEAGSVKPVAQEQEEEQIIGQSKPVDAPKPSRRKPSVSYVTKRKPANSYPLRKMPQTAESSANHISESTNEIVKPAEEEAVKPAVNKFSRRPVTNFIKEKIPESPITQISSATNENIRPAEEEELKPAEHKFIRRPITVINTFVGDKSQNVNSKPEDAMPSRTDLLNHLRKRPSLFNRKPVEQSEEETPEEQAKADGSQKQQHFSILATDMSNSNAETQVADAEIEASESNNVSVKAQEANEIPENDETINKMSKEPVHVLEAFEEIPAVISEAVEAPNAEEEVTQHEQTLSITTVKSDNVDEPQIIEAVQSNEESETYGNVQQSPEAMEDHIRDETPATPEKTQNIEETQEDNEHGIVEETHVIPQSLRNSGEVFQSVDETKKAEITQAEETYVVEEAQTVEENQAAEEMQTVDEHKVAEETHHTEQAENIQEAQAAEEMQTVDEHKVAEEMHHTEQAENIQEAQAAGEMQTVDEHQVPEESESPEETKIVDETEAAEESKIVEEISAANEALPAEEVPAAEEVLSVEEASPVDRTETENGDHDLAENIEEVQNSPTNTISQEDKIVESPSNEEVSAPEQNNDSVQSTDEEEDLKPNGEQTENEEKIHTFKESAIPAGETLDVKELAVQQVEESSTSMESEHSEPADDMINHPEESDNMAVAQTIEQMESEKPAEAPELMQATDEMSHPQPVVQQMYDDMNMNKQSFKGLKPVDPVMAQEAEQLIADFINTLRKNEFTNETPGIQMEYMADKISEEQETDSGIVEVQDEEETAESQVVENQNSADTNESPAAVKEEKLEDMQEVQEKEHSKEEAAAEDDLRQDNLALKSLENQNIKNVDDSQQAQESAVEAMILPQEIYQIPVKVITDPAEETVHNKQQSHESETQFSETSAKTEEESHEDESPAVHMAGNKPLSIDDIVELVKERLDQMPKSEMEAPMQLEHVLGEVQDKINEEDLPVASQQDEQQPSSQSVEETVMPIYQRVAEPIHTDMDEQSETLKQNSNIDKQTQTLDDISEIREKTNRSYKTKLDSRKRRFLFKADSS